MSSQASTTTMDVIILTAQRDPLAALLLTQTKCRLYESENEYFRDGTLISCCSDFKVFC